MAKFTKGMKRPAGAGRKKGTPNKITAEIRDVFLKTFKSLQRDTKAKQALRQWAKDNATEFYKLAAKLLPKEFNLGGDTPLQVKLNYLTGDDVPKPPEEPSKLGYIVYIMGKGTG